MNHYLLHTDFDELPRHFDKLSNNQRREIMESNIAPVEIELHPMSHHSQIIQNEPSFAANNNYLRDCKYDDDALFSTNPILLIYIARSRHKEP